MSCLKTNSSGCCPTFSLCWTVIWAELFLQKIKSSYLRQMQSPFLKRCTVPVQKRAKFEKYEISKMFLKEIIKPAQTTFAPRIPFAPKENCSLQFCVDFRKSNVVTKRDIYQIPRMEECIDLLGETLVFSTSGANSGYGKVETRNEYRDKTAITSHHGLYRFAHIKFLILECSE